MPPELLDNSIIKMARVAKEAAGNVEGVLQPFESVVEQGNLGSFP
jgi:hypothetical protein